MFPALSKSETVKPAVLVGATAARQFVRVCPLSLEIERLMWSPSGPARSQEKKTRPQQQVAKGDEERRDCRGREAKSQDRVA
jgi:hypothetical protein